MSERWRNACRDGRLPTRADFTPESMTPWMGHIQIVGVVRDNGAVRFRVRLVGTRIVYYEGRDNTGVFLDEVVPEEQHDEVLEPYRRSLDERIPVYSEFYSCAEDAISSKLERLILPLATDGIAVDQFLVAIYRQAS